MNKRDKYIDFTKLYGKLDRKETDTILAHASGLKGLPQIIVFSLLFMGLFYGVMHVSILFSSVPETSVIAGLSVVLSVIIFASITSLLTRFSPDDWSYHTAVMDFWNRNVRGYYANFVLCPAEMYGEDEIRIVFSLGKPSDVAGLYRYSVSLGGLGKRKGVLVASGAPKNTWQAEIRRTEKDWTFVPYVIIKDYLGGSHTVHYVDAMAMVYNFAESYRSWNEIVDRLDLKLTNSEESFNELRGLMEGTIDKLQDSKKDFRSPVARQIREDATVGLLSVIDTEDPLRTKYKRTIDEIERRQNREFRTASPGMGV